MLQLASRMLTSAPALRFFYGLMSLAVAEGVLVNGKIVDRVLEVGKTGDEDRPEIDASRTFRAADALTRAQEREVLAFLDVVARRSVFYAFRDCLGPQGIRRCIKAGAGQAGTRQRWIGRTQNGAGAWGEVDYPHPHICLRWDDRVSKIKEWQRPDCHLSVGQVRNEYFSVATSACHEVAHAVANVLFANCREPFFEDEGAAELGFAFESYVLGGMCGPGFSDEILVQEWPVRCVYARSLEL